MSVRKKKFPEKTANQNGKRCRPVMYSSTSPDSRSWWSVSWTWFSYNRQRSVNGWIPTIVRNSHDHSQGFMFSVYFFDFLNRICFVYIVMELIVLWLVGCILQCFSRWHCTHLLVWIISLRGTWCLIVYYESRKRELKTRPTYECRSDERLKLESEKSTRKWEIIVVYY